VTGRGCSGKIEKTNKKEIYSSTKIQWAGGAQEDNGKKQPNLLSPRNSKGKGGGRKRKYKVPDIHLNCRVEKKKGVKVDTDGLAVLQDYKQGETEKKKKKQKRTLPQALNVVSNPNAWNRFRASLQSSKKRILGRKERLTGHQIT